MLPQKVIWLFLSLTLLAGLSACKTPVTDDPRHDQKTEARREQDCANPQWKAANLGLWYNICSDTQQ